MAKVIKQDYLVSGDSIFIALCVLVALTIWSLISSAVMKEKMCWVEEQIITQNELRAKTYQEKIIEKE
jgi:hypothetical protein